MRHYKRNHVEVGRERPGGKYCCCSYMCNYRQSTDTPLLDIYPTAMKQEILRVFFVVAVCLSVMLLLASDHSHGLGISVESEESSPSCCSSDSCCSSHHSKLRQSSQMVNGGNLFSRNLGSSEALNSFVDITSSSEFVDNTTCTTWRTPSNSSSCECGSSLGGIVECDSSSGKVSLLWCYCMTFDVNESMLVVGQCLYGRASKRHANPYYPLPSNTSELNELCSRHHREGQLCGKCETGYALPVYSYNTSCVNCTNHYANNWVKYLAVSLLPTTLLFTVIVTCRLSVTSGVMNAFILLCQTARVYSLIFESYYGSGNTVFRTAAVAFTFCSMWNLDFFRALYPPFCLHPETTTLQILALDYVIAVYPLVLLVVLYLFVKLHDSNFKIIVCLWRPFHRCFVHFRRDWNIKTSLIDAFATFLLLSYMKFLTISFDILASAPIFNLEGETLSKYYLYWDGTVEFFGSKHLPYAILALTVVIIFNILPLLLLCLYPCRWFQKCLNHCRFQNQILHIFMDAFQGCYKDGTNGGCDCRWFAGLYLFFRIPIMVFLGVTISLYFLPLVGCAALVLLLLTAVLQPYKANVHNRINIFFLSVTVFIVISAMAHQLALFATVRFKQFTHVMLALSYSIPVIYIIGVVLYKLFGHRMWVQSLYKKLCRKCIKPEDEDFERILPERMVNVEECAILLADPMEVNT